MKKKYILISCIVIIILLALLAKKGFIITLQEYKGKNITPDYVFSSEKWDHPRLQLLRSQEKIDSIISKGKSEFEKIIILRHWVHSQWGSGWDFYYPPWDALLILGLSRRFSNRGFCAQYAIVFLQSCLSVGISARYVDLPGHFTVEVWSNEYEKWIIMDPANDLYFERKGIPLSGIELDRAFWSNSFDDIYQVNISSIPKQNIRMHVTKEILAIYRIYSIIRRNNQLSEPVSIVRPRLGSGIIKLVPLPDYKNYPHISKESLTIMEDVMAYKNIKAKELPTDRILTDNINNFEYYINQTMIQVAGKNNKTGEVDIVLIAVNPATFKNFFINIDNSGYRTSENVFKWKLKPGNNLLKARLETNFRWKGPANRLVLFYKPPLF